MKPIYCNFFLFESMTFQVWIIRTISFSSQLFLWQITDIPRKKKASLDNLGVKNAIRINNLLYLFIVLLINTTITVKQNYGTIYRQLWDYSLFFWYKVKRNFVHWRALKLSVIISIHVFPFRFQAVGFLTQRGALLSLDIPTKFQLGKIEILFIFT